MTLGQDKSDDTRAPLKEVGPLRIGHYLREIELQCGFALTCIGICDVALVGGHMGLFWLSMQGFLVSAALVSRILWPTSQSGPAADKRGGLLRGQLEVVGSSALQNRTLRDHIEHMDERLDKWAQTSVHHMYVDMSIGPIERAIPDVKLSDVFRHYNPSTRVVSFQGDSLDIDPVVRELLSLREKARALLTIDPWR